MGNTKSSSATPSSSAPKRRATDNGVDAGSGAGPRTSSEMGGVIDRRLGLDRRDIADRKKSEGNAPTGLERRRGAGRRLSDFQRSADEGEMTAEQFLFLMAIDAFKKANGKTFPNWSDVLEVIRLLGYRKTMPSELNLRNAEDWKEEAEAPSNVRPFGWERRFSKKELAELEELAGDISDDDLDLAESESDSEAA
tara:strand:+ start:36 stop:620 length:585 start_codon:yes stop_codon:yes gene_type:complete